jgi:hypothetical protein
LCGGRGDEKDAVSETENFISEMSIITVGAGLAEEGLGFPIIDDFFEDGEFIHPDGAGDTQYVIIEGLVGSFEVESVPITNTTEKGDKRGVMVKDAEITGDTTDFIIGRDNTMHVSSGVRV